MKYEGVIASNIDSEKTNPYRGYDLRLRRGAKGRELEDFELIFNNFNVERGQLSNINKIIENFNNTIFKFQEEKAKQEKIAESSEEAKTTDIEEEKIIPFKGQAIKEISLKKDETTYILNCENTKENIETLKTLVKGKQETVIHLKRLAQKLIKERRIGNLDIATKEGVEYLVRMNEDSVDIIDRPIDYNLLKKTIYNILGFYFDTKRFKEQLSLKHSSEGFTFTIKNGVLTSIEKENEDFTDIEFKIAQDLIAIA